MRVSGSDTSTAPSVMGLSPKVTGGETDALLQPLRSIVSPSVMTCGHATSLTEGGKNTNFHASDIGH